MKIHSLVAIAVAALYLTAAPGARAQDSVKEAEELDFAQGLLTKGLYDLAIQQCRKFITDYPQSQSLPDAYLSLGEGYFLAQDFSKAVDTFDHFIQMYPHSDKMPVSLLRLAQIDIQEKKFDEAIKELNSIDAANMLKGSMLQSFDFYIAKAYLGKSDTAAALEYFQKAQQVEGAGAYTADALKEMGQIHAQMGRYPEALDAYAKAMQATQDDALKVELTYRIAEVQFSSGKYDDAVKGFGLIIGQDPGSEFAKDALANLLMAYYNQAQYDQLLAAYQKYAPQIKDDESYFQVHLAAVLAFAQLKQYEQAYALLDRMLAFPSLNPQEKARVFTRKADLLVKQQKFKGALAILESNPTDNTDSADEACFLRGQANFGLKDFDRAFGFFEKVTSAYPNSRFAKPALLGEANARQEMGKLKEAEDLFLKYSQGQDQPELKSEGLYDAVMMAVKAGDAGGAIGSCQAFLKQFPKDGHAMEILLLLAEQYGRNNQPQQAVELLQDALAKDPSPARPNSFNFLLGYNQQLMGKNDEALASYAKVDPQKEDGRYYNDSLKNSAIVFLNQKKLDQANTYFDRLISLAGPHDLKIETYVWVCNQYLKEQRFDDVLRIAVGAEKNFPPTELQEIKYFEAEAQRGLGHCDEAVKDYALAFANGPKNAYTASAHIGQGLCLAKDQKYDEANKEFQTAMDETPDDYTVTAHARFEMANAAAAQGRKEDALKLYLLISTIYEDEYYCSVSLLKAAETSEGLGRHADAQKLYKEIVDNYKNAKAAQVAKERLAPR